jgi:hypothetical protein
VKQQVDIADVEKASSAFLVVGRPREPSPQSKNGRSFMDLTAVLGRDKRKRNKHEELRIVSHNERMRKTPTDMIGPIEKLILSFNFEVFFAVLITVQTLVMAMEAEYVGLGISHDLFERHSAGERWPGAEIAFKIFSWIFGISFSAEIILKMMGLRERFWKDAWNWFDTVIVLCWVVESGLEENFSSLHLGVDPQFLRIMRLARLVRLVRLVRTIQGFDALYVMTTALAGSLTVLAWSCVVLLVFQSLLALLLQKVLADLYFTDSSQPLDKRQEVFLYFGTFTRALFSMYEITLANWPPVSRVLAENVTQWFMLFAVVHKLTVGFTLVGIVNGVLMQETFKVASTDDRIMVRQKEKAVNMHAKKMHLLFRSADSSGNGKLDLQEFRQVLTEPGVKTWLSAMELDAGEDADNLFSLLDKEGGQVSSDALIKGMARLKGTARCIDMVSLMREVKELQALVTRNLPEVASGQGAAARTLSSPRVPSDAQSYSLQETTDDGSPLPVRELPSRGFCRSESGDSFAV